MSLPEAASQSLAAVYSALAVRIRVPSGLNAALKERNAGCSKEAMSLPEAASQSLAL